MRIERLAAAVAALAIALGAGSGFAQLGELVDPTKLRVCADPHNLPFSDQAGEGFENKIAELLAEELGVEVTYTWYPQSIGFVRNTLGARVCDVVMGISSTSELLQNTNPYYRSSYVLVQRADAGTKVRSLHDPGLKDLRIGAVARTPPVDLLARQGLLKNLRPYHLVVDTRFENPGRQMVEDVAAGEIDVGILWGPIGGFWAKQQSEPLEVVPLTDEGAGARLDFRITMGLRRDEPEWKAILNEFIAAHEDEIQAILLDYGVPLLDRQGRPIEAAPGTRRGALEGFPEPAGFRMKAHREGIDGWAAAGLPLEAAKPVPMRDFVETDTAAPS
jgi:quinoprotein dehydrogenase-associated probable ABC transporter substrate-binding protein